MPQLLSFLRANALFLGTGALLTLLSAFGQTFFISIFAGEIRAEFGLSHGEWGGLYATATTASAIAMVFIGGLTDKIRVRILGPLVILCLATAAFSMSQVSALWALGGTLFALRLFGQGMMSHTAMVAMSRWFIATRGRAVGIAGLGFALGEALLPLSFVALLGVYDWRALWVGVAVAMVIVAPLVMVLLKHERTPQSFVETGGSTGMHGRMWSRAQVLRDPVFWLMIPSLMGPAAWNTAFFFHQVHLAEVKGWGHATLVGLFPWFTLAAVFVGLVAGWLVDRFSSARLMPFYLLGLTLGYGLFAVAQSPVAGAVAMMCMGASVGANGTMMSTLWAEIYGTQALGAIRSMLAAFIVLGTAIGPGVTGVLIDAGIDYARQGWGVAAYFLVASALAWFASRRVIRATVAG